MKLMYIIFSAYQARYNVITVYQARRHGLATDHRSLVFLAPIRRTCFHSSIRDFGAARRRLPGPGELSTVHDNVIVTLSLCQAMTMTLSLCDNLLALVLGSTLLSVVDAGGYCGGFDLDNHGQGAPYHRPAGLAYAINGHPHSVTVTVSQQIRLTKLASIIPLAWPCGSEQVPVRRQQSQWMHERVRSRKFLLAPGACQDAA